MSSSINRSSPPAAINQPPTPTIPESGWGNPASAAAAAAVVNGAMDPRKMKGWESNAGPPSRNNSMSDMGMYKLAVFKLLRNSLSHWNYFFIL